ncbi:MAG: hypothetical protein RL757_162 [Bacteroidota bacterium]|jgi:hypothetical protein
MRFPPPFGGIILGGSPFFIFSKKKASRTRHEAFFWEFLNFEIFYFICVLFRRY